MWPNPHLDLVIFTEEILDGKLHFLCSVIFMLSFFIYLVLSLYVYLFNQFVIFNLIYQFSDHSMFIGFPVGGFWWNKFSISKISKQTFLTWIFSEILSNFKAPKKCIPKVDYTFKVINKYTILLCWVFKNKNRHNRDINDITLTLFNFENIQQMNLVLLLLTLKIYLVLEWNDTDFTLDFAIDY